MDKTALILIGSATNSAFDIGAMKVLFKNHIPDVVIATSAGSMNASFVLKDKNFTKNLKEAERIWSNLEVKDIFKLNSQIFYKLYMADSIYDSNVLETFVKNQLGFDGMHIEDLEIPTYIGAIDFHTGKTVLFDKGHLADAVIASCSAIPLFSPKVIDGKHYIDGAVDVSACIDKAEELGCKRIFLVHGGKKEPLDYNFLTVASKITNLMKMASIESVKRRNNSFKLHEICSDRLYIPYIIRKNSKAKEVARELMKEGEKKAREALKQIK